MYNDSNYIPVFGVVPITYAEGNEVIYHPVMIFIVLPTF